MKETFFFSRDVLSLKSDARGTTWWLRIHLPMQETQVQSLDWEDPTCSRANELMGHNY